MQGTIQAVNKNGILLGDKWYNATKECEKYITPELKGCKVDITLLPNSTLFNYIVKLGNITEGKSEKTVSEVDMKYRAMSISYAKDMVISEDITCGEMIDLADGIFHYITTGERKQ
jgi:hypothetical protein